MVNMTTREMNEITREEWRELGFFYDYDKENSSWRLLGSHDGLLKFVEILESYVADPRNEQLSEDEHYGPYSYLKLMTWQEAEIAEGAICGTLPDFRRLSAIVRKKLDSSRVGGAFKIGEEYAPASESVFSLNFVKKASIRRAQILSYRTLANKALQLTARKRASQVTSLLQLEW